MHGHIFIVCVSLESAGMVIAGFIFRYLFSWRSLLVSFSGFLSENPAVFVRLGSKLGCCVSVSFFAADTGQKCKDHAIPDDEAKKENVGNSGIHCLYVHFFHAMGRLYQQHCDSSPDDRSSAVFV